MVIKVYMSSCSGSMETKRKQDFVVSILESYRIPFEEIDISDSARDTDKQFMRMTAQPVGTNRVPLPPQIFNEEIYCGNYDAFHEANENNELNEFLKISTQASQKIITTANESDANHSTLTHDDHNGDFNAHDDDE